MLFRTAIQFLNKFFFIPYLKITTKETHYAIRVDNTANTDSFRIHKNNEFIVPVLILS